MAGTGASTDPSPARELLSPRGKENGTQVNDAGGARSQGTRHLCRQKGCHVFSRARFN